MAPTALLAAPEPEPGQQTLFVFEVLDATVFIDPLADLYPEADQDPDFQRTEHCTPQCGQSVMDWNHTPACDLAFEATLDAALPSDEQLAHAQAAADAGYTRHPVIAVWGDCDLGCSCHGLRAVSDEPDPEDHASPWVRRARAGTLPVQVRFPES